MGCRFSDQTMRSLLAFEITSISSALTVLSVLREDVPVLEVGGEGIQADYDWYVAPAGEDGLLAPSL